MEYAGVTNVLSGELKELTDHNTRFMSDEERKNAATSPESSAIDAFDPFAEGTSTIAGAGEEDENDNHEAYISARYHQLDTLRDENYNDTSSRKVVALDDVTERVHNVHFALLYLMSNPSEFKCLNETDDADDNAQIDNQEPVKEQMVRDLFPEFANDNDIPLSNIIFAEDAEVVLPQAHTASQMFGLEQRDGIELEAAAGLDSICELFRRWLALMPGGDHFHVFDPPGLTVMKIAGGRYRATAVHRVVWKWLNDFFPEDTPGFSSNSNGTSLFVFGDLVTMTIYDIFETDETGRLLSYAPTFDNKSVTKTSHTSETIRKQSNKMKTRINNVANSRAITEANKGLMLAAQQAKKIAGKMTVGLGDRLNISVNPEDDSEDQVSPQSKKSWLKRRQEKKAEEAKADNDALEKALHAVDAVSSPDRSSEESKLPPHQSSLKRHPSTPAGSFVTVGEF